MSPTPADSTHPPAMSTLPEVRWSGAVTVGRWEIALETGRIARQADGAVLIRQGDTVMLVTAVAAAKPREGVGFFPLTVEYRERLSAAGRFPGGYRKREGRSSDREILACRLTDRTVRPLFPEGFTCETQVLATVLSYEPDTDPEVLAITGAAAALHLSDIPFDGPVAAARIALTSGGEWVVFPSKAERMGAKLEFVVSISRAGLVMLEGQSDEASEDEVMEAMRRAEEELGAVLALLEKARVGAGVEKREFVAEEIDAEMKRRVERLCSEPLREALKIPGKHERGAAVEVVRRGLVTTIGTESEKNSVALAQASAAFQELEYRVLRTAILDGVRVDGRGNSEIRPIRAEAGLLPRVHGSSLFTRGETQALVVCTLGTGQDEQESETIEGVERERFQLHYSFPPYSVGETKPIRGPGRREIGHGNLARRALEAMLPTSERFPYTIKIESEITESNGSSSMATVCGGCLALMDAGVPVRRPVAGIAMGLVREGQGADARVAVLSDILGVEDHLGDMDFKVAGTTEGITAVQLDNKIGSLPLQFFAGALAQAREGRLHILSEMGKALAEPRADLAPHAPRIAVMKIGPHRIRDLIGAGGRTIQDLQASTGVKVDVDDTGRVRIYAREAAGLVEAQRRVRDLTGEPEVGAYYRGTVTGMKDFGVFVRIFQGIEGLVHASELGDGRGGGPPINEGDSFVVKVIGVENGKIALSRREAAGVSESELEN